MAKEEYYPLFETKRGKGKIMYIIFSFSLFVGICSIWVYRLSYIPKEDGKWVWIGLLCAELWFGFYWFLRQALRWNPIFRQPFPERLSQRYENMLPKVDIFVCTANPDIEPPIMVINTVLSVMAYDYPTEKLSVYLSDDGGSDITFYALLEASKFAKHWLPFCKRFKVEPRSPDAYFKTLDTYPNNAKELLAVKRMYQDMESRVENASKLGEVPKEAYSNHKEFSQWNSYSSRRDHDTILQILLHRKDHARDEDGVVMPTLVYLAREKRPQFHHNFKAGAMNSLIRVSSMISNGKIILNVDCDMYSNNSQSIRDALCFFMDEEKGHEIAFVQAPQGIANITKNDIYGGYFRIPHEIGKQKMAGNNSYSTVSGSSSMVKSRLVCYCGVESPLVTAWTDENPGRRFHGCGKYFQRRKCSFFRWFDPEVPERQKKLIKGLLKKNDAMKKKEKKLELTIVVLGMLLFLSLFVMFIKLG